MGDREIGNHDFACVGERKHRERGMGLIIIRKESPYSRFEVYAVYTATHKPKGMPVGRCA